MLISDITVTCERGYIRIAWEWADKAADSVRIYYKKDGAQGGGSLFAGEEIMRMQHSKRAEAKRRLGNEWGLYTFILAPMLEDGSAGEKEYKKHVMIGDPVRVPWKFSAQKEGLLVRFPDFTGTVPEGTACLEFGTCRYRLDYELTGDTVLLFPWQADAEKVKVYTGKPPREQSRMEGEITIYAREPLDQAYYFYKVHERRKEGRYG